MKSIAITLSVLLSVLTTNAQRPEISEWEAHGLTVSEWSKIDSLGIPLSRIDSVTAIGVTVSDYLRQPWVLYQVTFQAWYKLRRSGKPEDEVRRCIEKRKWRYRQAPKRRSFSKGIEHGKIF